MPGPALVEAVAAAAAEIAPPTVRLLDATVTVRLALMVTAPVPRLRSLGPAKVKSTFQFWALLVESVIAVPLVLPMVPPEMVKAGAQGGGVVDVELPGGKRRPAAVGVGAVEGQRARARLRQAVALPLDHAPDGQVIGRDRHGAAGAHGDRAGAEIEVLGPANVKSPSSSARVGGKGDRRAAGVADVPPEMLKVPVPRAEALLRLSCPAERVVPPL